MATYYVSDTDGSDSNNGTSKTTALKTIPYAFQLAAGTGNTIEIIDSATRLKLVFLVIFPIFRFLAEIFFPL